VACVVIVLLTIAWALSQSRETLQPTSTPLFKEDIILLEGNFNGTLTFFQIEGTGDRPGVYVGHRIPIAMKLSLAKPHNVEGVN